jgi:hypothetical protein
MPAKAVDARMRLTRNHRFRGHGPLLQFAAHPPPAIEAPVLVEAGHAPMALP